MPTWCVGCEAPGGALCPGCRRLADAAPQRRVVGDSGAAMEVWFGAHYEGIARDVILGAKGSGAPILLHTMRGWVQAALKVWLLAARGPVVVVPLHSGHRTQERSGRDIPAWIARRCVRDARRLGVAVEFGDLLRRPGLAREQKALGAGARHENARRQPWGVRVGRRPPGRCLLVDDVATTGASLLGARAALSAHGWDVLGGAVATSVRGQAGDPAAAAVRCGVSV